MLKFLRGTFESRKADAVPLQCQFERENYASTRQNLRANRDADFQTESETLNHELVLQTHHKRIQQTHHKRYETDKIFHDLAFHLPPWYLGNSCEHDCTRFIVGCA